MPWKLVTNSDLHHLDVPQRFFAYAHAYLDAATALCSQMVANPQLYTWPHGSVVLILSAHSVELFLKGSLFKLYPPEELEHPRLEDLAEKLFQHFKGHEFELDIPFKTNYAGFNEAEVEALKKRAPIPSILYRYPVSRGGNEWQGAYGFEAHSCIPVLENLQAAYVRIEPLVN